MAHRRVPFVATAIATLILLTGCAAPDADGAGAGAETGAPTSSPIESPAASESTPPDEASVWTIDGGGIGPIRRGDQLPLASTAIAPYAKTEEAACPNPAVSFYVADAASALMVVAGDDQAEVRSVFVGSWTAGFESPGWPATEAGIALGADLDELQSAYPDLQSQGQLNNSFLYSVPIADGWIVFTLQDDRVVMITASPDPTVPGEYCG